MVSQQTRRSFLSSVAALGVAALLPSWLIAGPRRLDLRPFCRKGLAASVTRFGAMNEPFIQESAAGLFAYATDGHICVRADAASADKGDESIKRPAAHALAWPGDVRGWQPWPRQDWIMAYDSDCHVCEGYGVVTFDGECDFCDGGGQRCKWCQEKGDWCERPSCDGFDGPPCSKCRGSGIEGTHCPACKGSDPICLRPGLQRVGGLFIPSCHDHRIRGLGECEYIIEPMQHAPHAGEYRSRISPAIKFRFDGGCGLLLPVIGDVVEKRLTLTKRAEK